MPSTPVHRELILPNPVEKIPIRPTPPAPITLALWHASWLEIHRDPAGTVRCYLGAEGPTELNHTFHCLTETFPGLQLGSSTTCPFQSLHSTEMGLLRAVPVERRHYWPMRLLKGADRAGLLFRSLAAKELGEHEVVLQVLFRRVPYWESGFLVGSYDLFLENKTHGPDRTFLQVLQKRKAEPPYHVEIRAAVGGPNVELAENALSGWLNSWTSVRGNRWWIFRWVKLKPGIQFFQALFDHDMTRFAAKKARRNISASELAQVLPIPWRDHLPGLAYVGAPGPSGARQLVRRGDGTTGRRGIAVGYSGDEKVRLPEGWHHLAILGKTRSGKSTLALNVVGRILANQPRARVIVLEPTGNLIRDLVERLPPDVVQDAIEIDPSHPTFERDGVEMAAVPLNLLHLPGRHELRVAELERRVERLLGDLLQAIRNAWGEESIGGRAEFILRAVLQGLLTVEGTNFADAYTALSDKEALRKLERLSRGALLKKTLGHHLARLDYEFTFSSLDKVGKIATNPLLRKATCQRYHAVSFDQLLEHRLLLLNLAKGALGTDSATFLGAIFLTRLWSAIQERPVKNDPIYLVVDEFHNFAIPAFADMLSEGAGLGLHVVAITQYLSRIPDRVRSALIGNVDAWALFPLGSEDAKEAFELVQGARFGWKPEHLIGGLAPYQAALSIHGELTKIDTLSPPRVPPHADANRATVQDNSRRYARPEDSAISPLALSTVQVATYLHAIPKEGSIRGDELVKKLGWPLAQVDAATALCVATGCVEYTDDPAGGGLTLRTRGRYYLRALDLARNEREDHCGLLADSAAYLLRHGIAMELVVQQGGYLLPDGQFEWRDRTYSVEVECGTLVTHHEQVARNLRKALALGSRVLVVVEDRRDAETFARVLKKEAPEAEIWGEVGLMWRDGAESMVPCDFGSRKPWGFLPGGVDDEPEGESENEEDERIGASVALSAADDPLASDLARAFDCARRLQEQGRTRVSATDFKELTEGDNGNSMSLRRLGMALSSLGVRSQRVMRNGVQVREYDLRTLIDRSGQRRAYPGDPTGRDAKDASGES